MNTRKYVKGIGGIFFKSRSPKKLQQWYADKLGFYPEVPFSDDDSAISFRWKTESGENHCTVWAPFPEDTTYFEPSKKGWMINYVVEDIEALLDELKKDGIEQVGELKTYEYGKFAQVLDPEENVIEFWEPARDFFEGIYESL